MSQKYTVDMLDGLPITVNVKDLGASDTVVIVNAFGAGEEILDPLARYLSESFRVLTWSSRGGLRALTLDCSPEAHVNDVVRVVETLARGRTWLVGYCSGADIGLRALLRHARLFSGAVLISGTFGLGPDAPVTKEVELLRPLLRLAARSVQDAEAVRMALEQANRHFRAAHMAPVAAEMRRAASGYLADPESLYVYARMVLELVSRDVRRLACGEALPITILASKTDTVAHWQQSRIVAERFSTSYLVAIEDWDHYAIGYRDDAWLTIERELLGLARRTDAMRRVYPFA
jgi:pimeloyl-ACP methyl ester carboxylesterase